MGEAQKPHANIFVWLRGGAPLENYIDRKHLREDGVFFYTIISMPPKCGDGHTSFLTRKGRLYPVTTKPFDYQSSQFLSIRELIGVIKRVFGNNGVKITVNGAAKQYATPRGEMP
jgi:hypothetical protein